MSKDRHELHPLITDIQEKLGRIRGDLEKIRGTIGKIKEILERGFEDLHDAIYDSIEAQAELKLMERLAEVRSIPPQIEAEHERINQEREDITQRIDNVSQRYEEKHAELDQKATERVRNLGDHIFTILEDEFEDGIETPFVDALTPTWEELKNHNASAAAERNTQLRGAFDRADRRIDEFLARREALLDDISHHRVSTPLSIEEPTTLQIPFWIVTVERDGIEETTIVGPSRLNERNRGWFTVQRDPIEGLDDSLKQVASTDRNHSQWVVMEPTRLSASLDEYTTDRLGDSLSFAAEFEETVEEAEIRIEGGDS